tara:strand:- start:30 stop:245 length:216 start_codon:yes stop_codon:yes gene_type:complete
MGELTVKQAAQEEAERTFEAFIKYSKYGVYASLAFLLAVASCNFGVEDGAQKTGSQYNGEQYAPTNLNINK